MGQPSSNPFTPDQPIGEEERFFGREDAIEWVDDCFVAGQRFVLVYGTPRIGKTSLLLRLRPRLAARATSIYLDLAVYPQEGVRDLLWRLVGEVQQQLYGDREAPQLSREAYLSQLGYLNAEVFPAWRERLRGRHLVLLLDGLELARLKEGAWAELVLRLREIVSQEPDLYVVAAVAGASTETAEPVAALRGLPQWDLACLAGDQTEELLVGLARYQLGFDYDALQRIYVLTGGHPHLVHLFGAELYRRLAPFGQVTIHAVNDAASTIVGQAEGLLSREWEGLSREAQIVLAALGSQQGYRGSVTPWDIVVLLRRAGVERSAQAVEQALRELCSRRVMRWYGGSTYALRVELWRQWLLAAHPLPEVLHGKRQPAGAGRPARRPIEVDWGAILLWAGIALAIVVVARIWTSRSARSGALVRTPTATAARATPRPTATRVPLPGRIAYMARATAHDPWCIWVMRDDGTDPVRLTDGSSEDIMPAWSPEGSRLAFISNRSGNRDVWLINADGTRPENLTSCAADEWGPAWSPDGNEIAFASYRDGNWELYITRRDGSRATRITTHPAADYAPCWSPEGSRLAFVSDRDGNAEIYLVNRDGTGLQRLTNDPATDLAPQWSPDGQRIAFESYRDGNMEIYTVAPDGSDLRNVSAEPKSDEHGPSWSPDGQWLAYYSNRDGNWDVFRMRADGSAKTNLTMSATLEQGPAWQPSGPP